MRLVQFPLKNLLRDERCQMRVAFDEGYAQELADVRRAGVQLPAVDVFQTQRPRGYLADGYHRARAEELAFGPRAQVLANIHPGGLREAILFAAGANARHGLRPRPEDVRKAVATLLTDPEWGQWSGREIARRVGCGRDLVDRLKDQLAELSGAIGQIGLDGVRVQRNGTTYTMRFRDMTPQQRRAAAQEESAGHRDAWRRDLAEALGSAERHALNLGLGAVLGHVRQALEALGAPA